MNVTFSDAVTILQGEVFWYLAFSLPYFFSYISSRSAIIIWLWFCRGCCGVLPRSSQGQNPHFARYLERDLLMVYVWVSFFDCKNITCHSYAFSPGKDCTQWLVHLGVQRCDPFTSNRITLRDHSNFTALSEISWGSMQPPSNERGKLDILRTVRHRLWISSALWELETPSRPPSTRVSGFPCGSADK